MQYFLFLGLYMGQEVRMGFYIAHVLLSSHVFRGALRRNYLSSPKDTNFPTLYPKLV